MSLSWKSYLIAGALALLAILDAWTGRSLKPLWFAGVIVLAGALLIEFYLFRKTGHQKLQEALTVRLPQSVGLGETGRCELAFENLTDHTRSTRVQMSWQPSVTASRDVVDIVAAPAETVEHAFDFTIDQLGTLMPGTAHVRSLGSFGLAFWQCQMSIDRSIDVVPTRLRDAGGHITTRDNGARNRPRPAGSGTEIREIRDYQRGDPIKSIDWKATARTGTRKVRNFDPEDQLDIMLLVDGGRSATMQIGPLDRLGHSVNLSARLAELTQFNGDNLALMTYADEPGVLIPLGRGQRHLAMIRSSLAQLRATATESDPRAAITTVAKVIKRRALVIVMTQIDEFEAAGELLTALKLLARKHHVVVVNMVDSSIVDIAHASANTWRDPWNQLAGLEYENAIRHTRLEIERSGIAVINAVPERIENELFSRYAEIRDRRAVG